MKVGHLDITVDLPRVAAQCRELLEKQVTDELVRIAGEDGHGAATGSASCKLSYAYGHTMSWRCVYRRRDESPESSRSAAVGVTALGLADGLHFQGAFHGCNAAARQELVAMAIEALPARLKTPANEAMSKHLALVTSYRAPNAFHVSFGRVLPDEEAETTDVKLSADSYLNRCDAKD